MNKRTISLLLVLFGFTLAGCNPNFTDDSSVDSSSGESSEKSPSTTSDTESDSSSSEGGDEDDSGDSSEVHQHVKDDSEWKYNTTKHWHDCVANDGYHFDEANHTFTAQVIAPTYEAKGYTLHVCTVCGYEYKDQETDKLVHHYATEWTTTEEKHWHACTDQGYENLKSEEGPHVFNPALDVVTPPTDMTGGYTTHYCETCGYHYDSDFVNPTGNHHWADEWSGDDLYHWHACTDDQCTAQGDKAAHSYGDAVLDTSTEDISQYIKGTYKRTCSVCGHIHAEPAYYTKEEMCDLMNTYLLDKEYFDVFELRDDLIAHNYPVVDTLSAQQSYGYDTVAKKVAIHNGTTVTYPSGCTVNNFVSFREKIVYSLGELEDAIQDVGADATAFSSIKVANNITVTHSIAVNSQNPVEIDLDGHTLSNITDSSSTIRITKANNSKPVVVIKNGTIMTKDITGFDLYKSPSCVSLIDANSLRLSSLTLNNRAERGYAYIDYADKSLTANVKIENCDITSKIVAICVQTNNNLIKNNTITGVMVINGGTSVIEDNTIDASLVQVGLDREANRFIASVELYNTCRDVYVTDCRDTYMLTTTDAILIYDRRSAHATYGNPTVTIERNTLKCKISSGDIPYGYGVRYMDLAFDESLPENSLDLSLINVATEGVNANTFTYFDPLSEVGAGGYACWEAN